MKKREFGFRWLIDRAMPRGRGYTLVEVGTQVLTEAGNYLTDL